ncbi:tRNA ligase-like protein [Lepidopterella palustris CBS 459.81]|uniref:tRNA ligase n=1 Tax=Lepidopterella palustris CBS 459.81 TaxID=1314670 RepID=A0A8E2EGE7_9PEZI|nr:tRNA ligase-like protein [Lepidopterella palustris CBS 459.81]
MAHRETAPYRAQDPHEVKQLVQALSLHTKKGKGGGKGGFSVKKSTFVRPNGRSVDSWRMQDWDYKKEHLPTYARGLFTYTTLDGKDEIAVRGYDKFFNYEEVRKTEWRNVEEHTRGPYELSVKENGCIIFIAGLDDGTLMVCSKHSTGVRGDVAVSHAAVGERWVERHLKSVGKTKEQLAKKLREMNATAVAELCDDAFEEHVLAYAPETAGLYLHGINLNLPEFVTYPGHLVDKFAEEWGMKKVMYVMEDDIKKVRSFLEHVAETGSYNGRDTEGFVIRCQSREGDNSPWQDWFFKYKFEEPYLMYRQWRECTKAIISGRPPRFKKHKKITEEYLLYARRRFAREPGLSKQYNQNHGIISLREDFLSERGLKGSDIIRQEMENGEYESKDVKNNVVLVPVATIGCGKTTVALALVKLFGWGHFQNDNIESRQRRPQKFAEAICALMTPHPVVIADRNNHQKREREQIMADISNQIPETKFVALHYVHERNNYNQIRQATRERVLARGDNHQTIQAGSKGQDEIIEIMEGFMHRFQPVDTSDAPDDQFDLVIDLDPIASSRENLEVIVEKLHNEYPGIFSDMPTAEDLDAAIEFAMNDYEPSIKMDLSKGGKWAKPTQQNKQRQNQNQNPSQSEASVSSSNAVSATKSRALKLEYFSVRLPTQRINSILAAIFKDQDPNTARFYRQLEQSRRLQPEFHVTLMHRASAPQYPEAWDKLTQLHSQAIESQSTNKYPEPELGKCNVQLERLVWDSRIMCIVVRLNGSSKEGLTWESVNAVAHVTLGTASKDIKPKESNDLLQKWLRDGSGEQTGIGELTVRGSVVLEGSVRGVLQRF